MKLGASLLGLRPLEDLILALIPSIVLAYRAIQVEVLVGVQGSPKVEVPALYIKCG